MHMPPVPGILGMSLNSKDFEVALRAELNSKFLAHLPKEFLKMRVGDFLQLASVNGNSSSSSNNLDLETPRTAIRRSVRRQQNDSSTMSTLMSITKSVKRTLFPLSSSSTPSKLKPQIVTTQTPSVTVKRSSSVAMDQKTPSKRSSKVSRTPQVVAAPSSPGIVQFQLDDGKIVDVDFSRSPKSAFQDANLLGSAAYGEVQTKIETYANQFVQFLKFFKKFKPGK